MISQPHKLLGQPSIDIVGLGCKFLGTQETLDLLCRGGTQMLLIAKLRTVNASISTKDENCVFNGAARCLLLKKRAFSFGMSAKERTLRLGL